MEDINKQAELYAESFRYKVGDGSWYEQKKRDFIAGYEAALRIHDVVGQSEQLICDTCKSGLIDYLEINRRTCRCGGLGYNVTD